MEYKLAALQAFNGVCVGMTLLFFTGLPTCISRKSTSW